MFICSKKQKIDPSDGHKTLSFFFIDGAVKQDELGCDGEMSRRLDGFKGDTASPDMNHLTSPNSEKGGVAWPCSFWSIEKVKQKGNYNKNEMQGRGGTSTGYRFNSQNGKKWLYWDIK